MITLTNDLILKEIIGGKKDQQLPQQPPLNYHHVIFEYRHFLYMETC